MRSGLKPVRRSIRQSRRPVRPEQARQVLVPQVAVPQAQVRLEQVPPVVQRPSQAPTVRNPATVR
jgi:hypothetical protein